MGAPVLTNKHQRFVWDEKGLNLSWVEGKSLYTPTADSVIWTIPLNEGKDEDYLILGNEGEPREKGETFRAGDGIGEYKYTIGHSEFSWEHEERRVDLEDDRTGLIMQRIQRAGRKAPMFIERRVMAMLEANTVLGFDGLPLYSAAHVWTDRATNTAVQNNTVSLAGTTVSDVRAAYFTAWSRFNSFLDDKSSFLAPLTGTLIAMYSSRDPALLESMDLVFNPNALASNDSNRELKMRATLMPVPFLDPSSPRIYFFLVEQETDKPLVVQMRQEFAELEQWFNDEDDVVRFRSQGRFGLGHQAWWNTIRAA